MGGCGSKKADQKDTLLESIEAHEKGINCMALSEDGSVLATGSEDKSLRLWCTKTSQCECIGTLRGHEDYITCILIEDCYVLTGSADKTLRKWDVSTLECVLVCRGHTSVIYRMICTGDFIFTSSYDRTARCWDFDNGECLRVFRGHKRGVYPLIFIPADDDEMDDDMDPDGSKDILITGSADCTARSWNFETGQCLKVFKGKDRDGNNVGHTGAITCMATDALGRILFTGSTDTTVRSWNLLRGEQLKVFSGHTGSVICMQIVNKIMYTGSSDHTARAWVTEFGDCTRVFKGHKHTVSVVKVKDGLVYTGSGDCSIRSYDAKSGDVKKVFVGHDFAVTALEVVGGKLFTGSYDGFLKVWDSTGIKDDTTFGKEEKKEDKKDKDNKQQKVDSNQNGIDNKIMID